MAETSSCNLLVGFTTAYDKSGRRLFERHLHAEPRSHAYAHDEADRLTLYRRGKLNVSPEAAIPTTPPDMSETLSLEGGFTQFQYNLDKLGNWDDPAYTSAGASPSTTTEAREYNALNQITSVQGQALAYDANGNLTDDGKLVYEYDVFNRLRKVYLKGTGGGANRLLATYWYDALGRRVKSKLEERTDLTGEKAGIDGNLTPSTRVYLYAGDRCIEERQDTPGGKLLRQYVWGHYVDELIQQREFDPNDAANPGDLPSAKYKTFYPLSDLTWRTVALTDNNGRIVEGYDTDAYGRTLAFGGFLPFPPPQDPQNPAPPPANPNQGLWFSDQAKAKDADGKPYVPLCRHLFTGREYDPETGLYYFRARHYSPALGRFLQRDPLGYDAGDMNLYAYCGGSPLIRTDPSGEIAPLILWGLGILAAGAIAWWGGNQLQQHAAPGSFQYQAGRFTTATGKIGVTVGAGIILAPVAGYVFGLLPLGTAIATGVGIGGIASSLLTYGMEGWLGVNLERVVDFVSSSS